MAQCLAQSGKIVLGSTVAGRCLGCGNNTVQILVDFGPQPPSNRFELISPQETATHPLVIGQCGTCGLVQLVSPMPVQMARPRFEWLSYNEPEDHLDSVVDRLCKLPNMNADARIIGLTYKDDTVLQRFNRLGYGNTYRYDPAEDLFIDDRCAGLETIQSTLSSSVAENLVERNGRADLLVARHILEHAHDPVKFLMALSELISPDGYLLLEVPDATKFIGACDYSFVWEEHITYFSLDTLKYLIGRAGFNERDTFAFPYALEDALIAIGDKKAPNRSHEHPDTAELLKATEDFSNRYLDLSRHVKSQLRNWHKQGKRIGIFGAGHIAARFINIFSVSEFIECVVDDHYRKQGMLMPGSRVPIRGTAALEELDICLVSLSPSSERQVLAQHRRFLENGGQFISIFAIRSDSIYHRKTNEIASS